MVLWYRKLNQTAMAPGNSDFSLIGMHIEPEQIHILTKCRVDLKLKYRSRACRTDGRLGPAQSEILFAGNWSNTEQTPAGGHAVLHLNRLSSVDEEYGCNITWRLNLELS